MAKQKLTPEEKAYYCFCTPEELEAEKQAQLAKGETPVYSGKCADLPKETVEQYLKEGRPHVIRIKAEVEMSEGLVSWILQYGTDIKVIQPKALMKAVKEKASQILEMYE